MLVLNKLHMNSQLIWTWTNHLIINLNKYHSSQFKLSTFVFILHVHTSMTINMRYIMQPYYTGAL